jgi:hypothetical protein
VTHRRLSSDYETSGDIRATLESWTKVSLRITLGRIWISRRTGLWYIRADSSFIDCTQDLPQVAEKISQLVVNSFEVAI